MIFKVRKLVVGTVLGAALTLGATSSALADAPVFSIDPSVLPTLLPFAQFDANQISGSSSELLTTVGNTHTGSGWLTFGSFSIGGASIDAADTGLGSAGGYRLYVTFTIADQYRAGTGLPGQQFINGAGTVNDLTQLDFQFWADPTRNTTFVNANAATNTNATVTGTTSDDILLGVGNLLSGVSGFNEQGGATLNATQNFAICTGVGTATQGGVPVAGPLATLAAACNSNIGDGFFALPDPFYTLGFAAFNNTSQGVIVNGNQVSVNNAAGTVDFNGTVPEPGSLALLGLGLVGLAVAGKRRQA